MELISGQNLSMSNKLTQLETAAAMARGKSPLNSARTKAPRGVAVTPQWRKHLEEAVSGRHDTKSCWTVTRSLQVLSKRGETIVARPGLVHFAQANVHMPWSGSHILQKDCNDLLGMREKLAAKGNPCL